MERVERTNIVIVYPNQQVEFISWQNPYIMEMDRRNWNYYNCGCFGYMATNCRNRETVSRIREGRRLEYRSKNNRQSSNLNGNRNLIVLD